MTLTLGIDVAKAKLDVALRLSTGQIRSTIIANTDAGFAELQAWLAPHDRTALHVCMEATGIDWEAVAETLADAGFTVSVVNPARIKAYGAAPLDHSENRRLFLLQGAPTPRALQPAPAPPAALVSRGVRNPLVTGHHLPLIAFHLPRQDRFGLAGDDPFPQWLGHPLHIVQVQAQLLGDLGVRSV